MKNFSILIFTTSLILSQTGIEIARMVDTRKTPKDISNVTKMVLTNSKGKSRVNKMASKSMEGNKKQIIWFLEPKDDKGVAFLKMEHDNKDDEMRMWLPAFNKVRRISSKKKATSFMGSDLSYEDMTSRQIDEYSFKIIKEDIINNKSCYVLESKPKIKSEYSKHVTWVEKDTYLPLQEESYDKSNKLLKFKTFKYTICKSFHLITEIFVKNVQKQSNTRLKFSNLYINNKNIEDNLFKQKNMERLPPKIESEVNHCIE